MRFLYGYRLRLFTLVACVLFLSTILLVACGSKDGDEGGNGVTSEAGGEVIGTDLSDGQISLGDAVNGGNLEAAGNGNGGGNGDTGGADEDNSDATTVAPEYSPEIIGQLNKFNEAAVELSLDDVASASALLDIYRELALDGAVNDALFFSYEEHMQFVTDGLNAVYSEDTPDDGVVSDALENGFLFVVEDEHSSFELRPDFLFDTFSDSVSQTVRDYLELQAKHYMFHEGHGFLENDTLMITLNQLAEMIVDWEGYINTYPDVRNAADIKYSLDYYLKIYIGSIQIENSGLYEPVGTDANGETQFKLLDGPAQSYRDFLDNYPDSAAYPIVEGLLAAYEGHDMLYTVAIEDFFRDNGLAYDV